MDKTTAVVIFLMIIPVVFLLMWRGWQSRKKRQDDIPDLPEIPDLSAPLLQVEGQYISTTSAGDWLDRIAVHGLGIRTKAELQVHPQGVLFLRAGAETLFLPTAALSELRHETGMNGKFIGKDGIFVITWRHGDNELDTGFRPRYRAEHENLIAMMHQLYPQLLIQGQVDNDEQPLGAVQENSTTQQKETL